MQTHKKTTHTYIHNIMYAMHKKSSSSSSIDVNEYFLGRLKRVVCFDKDSLVRMRACGGVPISQAFQVSHPLQNSHICMCIVHVHVYECVCVCSQMQYGGTNALRGAAGCGGGLVQAFDRGFGVFNDY